MPAVIEARWEVKGFAAAMERRMQAHDADRGDEWKDCPEEDLADAFFAKLEAFQTCSVEEEPPLEVDMANFLMMLWNRHNLNPQEVV
jgi:hypothetical protein